MGVAKSVYSYPDCREFLNRAIDAKKGYGVVFQEEGKATQFRLRCYTARRRELERNVKIYPPGDMMHDRTAWDGLVFLIKVVPDGFEVQAIQDGSTALGAQVVRQGPIE